MRIIFLSAAVLLFTACQKAQRDEDNAVNTCEDIGLAQTIFADAYKQIRIAARNSVITGADSNNSTIYGCESISVDTVSDPATLQINYKFIGCTGMGAERSGRILAEFFGNYGETGSAIDITFLNYFFREYEVSGTIRIIWKEDDNGREAHSFYLQSGTVNDGQSAMSWTSGQNWIIDTSAAGESYIITGNSNGVNRKGNTFKSTILTEAMMLEDCLYVVSGILRIEDKNLSLRELNFGSGNCDRKALATINGATYNVVIP